MRSGVFAAIDCDDNCRQVSPAVVHAPFSNPRLDSLTGERQKQSEGIAPRDPVGCPICGNANVRVEKIVDCYKVWKCQECRLFWVPDVSVGALQGFYEGQYFTGSHEYGYADYVASESIQRVNARRLLRVIAGLGARTGVGRNAKLIDVGCAHGFFVDEACKAGFAAEGADLSREACEYAANVLHRRVFRGSLKEASFPAGDFDVVTSIGSIEHLINPIEFVEEVARVSKRDALFVVTTVDTRLHLYRFKPPEHLFYFSRKNLSLLLRAKGFTIEHVGHYTASHAIGEALGLLSKALFGTRLDLGPVIARLPWRNAAITLPNNEMLIVARKR